VCFNPGAGLRVPPVDGAHRAGGEWGAERARVLPTSGGTGSAGGSRYSSRAQPESLSDEAGGRLVAVPQGGGSSRWGHAGLGRDMSWGERIRAGETLGEAGSRGSIPRTRINPPAQRGPAPCGSRMSSPSSWGGTSEQVQPGRWSAPPRPRDRWLNPAEIQGLLGVLLSLQTHAKGMAA